MMDQGFSLIVESGGDRWCVDIAGYDLSIPLAFDSQQPSCFEIMPAREQVFEAGAFTGDVRRGGSCNCATYTLTPHGNGTHTECVGHLTAERLSLRELCDEPFCIALLVSVQPVRAQMTDESTTPQPQHDDLLITRSAIEAACRLHGLDTFSALIIRTLPNDTTKRTRHYEREPASYFTAEAMHFIVQQGVRHLVVDLPSVDRAADEGVLCAHRIFWGVRAQAVELDSDSRRKATITELAFVDEHIPDGAYLLNLQVAPFATDAAPSRPVVMALRRA